MGGSGTRRRACGGGTGTCSLTRSGTPWRASSVDKCGRPAAVLSRRRGRLACCRVSGTSPAAGAGRQRPVVLEPQQFVVRDTPLAGPPLAADLLRPLHLALVAPLADRPLRPAQPLAGLLGRVRLLHR